MTEQQYLKQCILDIQNIFVEDIPQRIAMPQKPSLQPQKYQRKGLLPSLNGLNVTSDKSGKTSSSSIFLVDSLMMEMSLLDAPMELPKTYDIFPASNTIANVPDLHKGNDFINMNLMTNSPRSKSVSGILLYPNQMKFHMQIQAPTPPKYAQTLVPIRKGYNTPI